MKSLAGWLITPKDGPGVRLAALDRKSTRLNSSHSQISYAVFCLKKKKIETANDLLSLQPTHTTQLRDPYSERDKRTPTTSQKPHHKLNAHRLQHIPRPVHIPSVN